MTNGVLTGTITERRHQLAQRLNSPDEKIKLVSVQIAFLREHGSPITVKTTGGKLFTQMITNDELGIADADVRHVKFKGGTKNLIPDVDVGAMRTLIVRLGKNLIAHSREIDGLRAGRWMPHRAFAEWKETHDDLEAQLETVKQMFVDRLEDGTYERYVRETFGQIAREAWDSLNARGLAPEEGYEPFTNRIITMALSKLPTPDDVMEKIKTDWYSMLIVNQSTVDWELAQQEQANAAAQAARLQAMGAAEREALLTEKAQVELTEAQKAAAERHKIELDHYREQIQDTMLPLEELMERMRAQIRQAVPEIVKMIDGRGMVSEAAMKRIRGLKETFDLFNVAEDKRLEELLARVTERVNVPAEQQKRKMPEEKMTEIRELLLEIEDLTDSSVTKLQAYGIGNFLELDDD